MLHPHSARYATAPCCCPHPCSVLLNKHTIRHRGPHEGHKRVRQCMISAYKSDAEQAASSVEALCMIPSSNMIYSEEAIKTFGQAFMTHPLHREVNTRIGYEQHVFAGISRCMLDSCSDDPVLYITEHGPASGAAIVLTNTQEAQLLNNLLDFEASTIPGTLQILQAIPEGSLPLMISTVKQLHESGVAAMQMAGYDKYLKLMLIAARPMVQGKGLGGALMRAITDAADQQKMPLYLEAAGDELVPLYERYAFQVLGKAGPMTLMVRDDVSRVQ